MIAQHSVEEVLSTARVEDVVGDYVNLKRAGSSLKGLCPFHAEKTPSFNVSPAKNIYKCFGCGKSGDAVQFLIEHEHFTFPEAIRFLAEKYSIELEETEMSDEAQIAHQERESLYLLNQFAQEYYRDQLWETGRGKSVGLSYFRNRGYRDDTIKKFGLGMCPSERDGFTRHALANGYTMEQLTDLGLTTDKGLDFLRERVIFPVHGLSGKVIAFAGRILNKHKKAPKYLNSKETELYHKSKSLYGIWFARSAIRKHDLCYMVEGYTDVISLHQGGVENVVASSGTSLTTEQIKVVKRFSDNLTLVYDGDVAGVKAAMRGLDLALAQGMKVRVIMLPDGEDPDSYLQKVGAADFKAYLADHARDFILFKMELLMAEAEGDPIKRSGLIRELLSSLALIPDPILQADYLKTCANALEQDEQLLVSELNKIKSRILKDKHRSSKASDQSTSGRLGQDGNQAKADEVEKSIAIPRAAGDMTFQERDIARILVAAGDRPHPDHEGTTIGEFIMVHLQDVLDDFDNKLYEGIVQEAKQRMLDKKPVSTQYFLSHANEDIRKFTASVLAPDHIYSENWEERHEIRLQTQNRPEENFHKDALLALLQFKLLKVTRKCQQNQKKIEALSKDDPEGELMTYLLFQKKMQEVRNKLAEQLGTVVLH